MVIDTSALLAILQDEPERRRFNEALESADARLISVATLVETSILVESRYGAEGLRDLDLLLERAGVEPVPVDLEQARAAREAWSRLVGEPLLYKGDDFSHTDVRAVTSPP